MSLFRGGGGPKAFLVAYLYQIKFDRGHLKFGFSCKWQKKKVSIFLPIESTKKISINIIFIKENATVSFIISSINISTTQVRNQLQQILHLVLLYSEQHLQWLAPCTRSFICIFQNYFSLKQHLLGFTLYNFYSSIFSFFSANLSRTR